MVWHPVTEWMGVLRASQGWLHFTAGCHRATKPPCHRLARERVRSFSLLNYTKCSFMIPVLSFSDSVALTTLPRVGLCSRCGLDWVWNAQKEAKCWDLCLNVGKDMWIRNYLDTSQSLVVIQRHWNSSIQMSEGEMRACLLQRVLHTFLITKSSKRREEIAGIYARGPNLTRSQAAVLVEAQTVDMLVWPEAKCSR